MNDDLISRQAVIDLISKFVIEIHSEGGRDLNAHTNDVLRQILRNVGSDRVLPPVNPQEIVRDCTSCRWSDDGCCAGTEECHLCMWESQYKPKTGHWIDQYNDGDWHCSKCGAIVEKDEQINHNWYFCYHCGCRMVEPQESDHKCHTCKHYTSGEHDGSCGSYICKGYSNWESEVTNAGSN